MARAAVDLSVVRGVGTWEVVPGRAGTYRPVIASAKLREGAPGSRLVFHAHLPHWRGARRRQRRTRSIAHGKNRIPYRIDRRLTCLAGPDYDTTISFGLSFEPEDSQYGKSRAVSRTQFWHQSHAWLTPEDGSPGSGLISLGWNAGTIHIQYVGLPELSRPAVDAISATIREFNSQCQLLAFMHAGVLGSQQAIQEQLGRNANRAGVLHSLRILWGRQGPGNMGAAPSRSGD